MPNNANYSDKIQEIEEIINYGKILFSYFFNYTLDQTSYPHTPLKYK